MTYRDDLAALAARRDALEHELAAKERELADTTQLLDEARARTRLPILDNIRVASPCAADWATMTGDDRVRHCGSCDKQVFNLSAMTRDEAQALLLERTGKICGRYYQRTDGTILLADCAIGARRRQRRHALALGGAAMLAGALAVNALPGPVEQRTLGADLGIRGAQEPIAMHGSAEVGDRSAVVEVMMGDLEF